MVTALFFITSCVDEDKAPIVTFDSAGHGGYPRLIEQGSTLINLLSVDDFNSSSYTYSVEFVDENKGANVQEYILTLDFDDNDASNGDNSKSGIELRKFTSADFTTSESGYQGVSSITITSADVAGAIGIGYSDLSPGDNFNISGSLVMIDGNTFRSDNSSATVQGAAFKGHFDFTLSATCPSDLAGTYDVTTTLWCGGTTTTTVDIVDNGGGVYGFSDWSFGAYAECWGGGAASGSFKFIDVCKVVTLYDGVDSYGDGWTLTSSISGNNWTIVWENYGYAGGLENGTSVITFPGPVPFTLGG